MTYISQRTSTRLWAGKLENEGSILDMRRGWCMCDCASYMKMTRGTNLMQQLWFIIIN